MNLMISPTSTATHITCDACGRDLTDPDEQRTGLCTDDLVRWFAEACAVAPKTFHPTSHDINRIVAKHATIGSAIRAMEREASGADFFEDDDTRLDEPDLSTTAEVQSALVEHQAWQRRVHSKDAAREAAHGYSVEHELSQVGPEPSDLLPDPADWLDIVASGDIPPHDGRRCPECGYPLTEAHASDLYYGWLLCPVCDTYNTGDDDQAVS